jgi:hypothetical protein
MSERGSGVANAASQVQVRPPVGNALDAVSSRAEQLVRQIEQRASRRDLLTDLGDLPVIRVAAGYAMATQLGATGPDQPRLCGGLAAHLAKRDLNRPLADGAHDLTSLGRLLCPCPASGDPFSLRRWWRPVQGPFSPPPQDLWPETVAFSQTQRPSLVLTGPESRRRPPSRPDPCGPLPGYPAATRSTSGQIPQQRRHSLPHHRALQVPQRPRMLTQLPRALHALKSRLAHHLPHSCQRSRIIPRAPGLGRRAYLRRRGIKATIAQPDNQRASRKRRGSAGGHPPAFDRAQYRRRSAAARCVSKWKQYRAVTTRYDKRDYIFNGTQTVASIMIFAATCSDTRTP